jgi:predicted phosphoribosyltransferase/dienelactone hydrolase
MFEDRHDAGRQLAGLLTTFAGEHPVVFALPRGGVPVAAEVARVLDAPLDVLTVRKLGAPENPEFGIGAVAEDGTAVVDSATARQLGITQAAFDRILERERHELSRRVARFRGERAPLDVHDRTVIVVDDGLATGLTDLAAVRALRRRGAGRIVVAVPVGSHQAVAMLQEEADEVICHTIPRELFGVGRWYRNFSQVSDDEVVALLAAAGARVPLPSPPGTAGVLAEGVVIELQGIHLHGDLTVPPSATGLVIFAHGSGSSRHSPRNRMVARQLEQAGLATLLFDLLAQQEEGRRDLVFDIPLLASRLEAVTRWARENPATSALPIGYFGASTGAGAALRAAANIGEDIRAVVSRGGRPDLAGDRLPGVRAATLLIVGSRDREVLALNRQAAQLLRAPHRVEVVDGAGHLFEEPGTLEAVASLAADWFRTHLARLAEPPARATTA